MDEKKIRLKTRGGRMPVNGSAGFKRLKALNCFKDVHQRMVEGWTLEALAQYIQEEKQEYTDISRASLKTILSNYRTALPAGVIAGPLLNPTQTRAIREMEDCLDELKGLEELYLLQMKRVNIDWGNEQTIKKLLPTMTQEIRAAKEILEAHHKIKQDNGITTRHLGTFGVEGTINHTETSNPAVQKVLSDPESRQKLLTIAQRLLMSASQAESDRSAEEIIEAELVGGSTESADDSNNDDDGEEPK